MKKAKFFITASVLLASATVFQSCLDNDDDGTDALRFPTAIVTVCPQTNGGFVMQLDDKTTLYPTNKKESPFGAKEVRALVNYTDDNTSEKSNDGVRGVYVNWIDSIRTKYPVVSLGAEDDKTYGNDPVEIVRDWVTVAEDGYLTLRFRTLWGPGRNPHFLNLVSGINPDDPFELEFRHDAKGDTYGSYGDALIAFNLNELPRTGEGPVKVKLHWNSFTGKKTAEFSLQLRPHIDSDEAAKLIPAASIK